MKPWTFLSLLLAVLHQVYSQCDEDIGPGRGVTEDDKKAILQVHNDIRNRVTSGEFSSHGLPPASDMRVLVWNDKLAGQCQRLVNQCEDDHERNNIDPFGVNYGQNLWEEYGAEDYPTKNWTKAVNDWFNEYELHSGSNALDKNLIEKTGHMSQVLWADTYFVGCGWSQFEDDDRPSSMYCCNYWPPGNEVGPETTYMYKDGKACSAEDCECDSTFKNLCKTSKDAPEPKKAEGSK